MKSNPFSTRYFQPGAIPYRFQDGSNAASLCNDFVHLNTSCLIVGPHGTGKSTLLYELKEAMTRMDFNVIALTFHSGSRSSQIILKHLVRMPKHDTLFIDGVEQIHWATRAVLKFCYRTNGKRLLATSHREFRGWRVLCHTSTSQETEKYVMERLLTHYDDRVFQSAMQSEEWKQSRLRHGQNLRESLFDMFDWWNQNEKTLS